MNYIRYLAEEAFNGADKFWKKEWPFNVNYWKEEILSVQRPLSHMPWIEVTPIDMAPLLRVAFRILVIYVDKKLYDTWRKYRSPQRSVIVGESNPLEPLNKFVGQKAAKIHPYIYLAASDQSIQAKSKNLSLCFSLAVVALCGWSHWLAHRLYKDDINGLPALGWDRIPYNCARLSIDAGVPLHAQKLAIHAYEVIAGSKNYHKIMDCIEKYRKLIGEANRPIIMAYSNLAEDLRESCRAEKPNFRAEFGAMLWTLGLIPQCHEFQALSKSEALPSRRLCREVVSQSVRSIPHDPLIQYIWLAIKDRGPFDIRWSHRSIFNVINKYYGGKYKLPLLWFAKTYKRVDFHQMSEERGNYFEWESDNINVYDPHYLDFESEQNAPRRSGESMGEMYAKTLISYFRGDLEKTEVERYLEYCEYMRNMVLARAPLEGTFFWDPGLCGFRMFLFEGMLLKEFNMLIKPEQFYVNMANFIGDASSLNKDLILRPDVSNPQGRANGPMFYFIERNMDDALDSTGRNKNDNIDLIWERLEEFRYSGQSHWDLVTPAIRSVSDDTQLSELLEKERSLIRRLRGAYFTIVFQRLPRHYDRLIGHHPLGETAKKGRTLYAEIEQELSKVAAQINSLTGAANRPQLSKGASWKRLQWALGSHRIKRLSVR